MLNYNPAQRLGLADLLAHPWMQGPVATQQQVVATLTKAPYVDDDENEEEEQH